MAKSENSREFVQTKSPLVFFCAGDLSGDLHAAHLILRMREIWAEMNPKGPALRFAAAGSDHLRNAGAEIWEETSTWGAMGIFEGIKRLPVLYRARTRLVERIRKENPDVVIAVDYRGFNMSLLKHVRTKPDGSIQKTAYYIAPVLWWTAPKTKSRTLLSALIEGMRKLPGPMGKGVRDRFEAMANLVDLALVAYPFSLDNYQKAGVNFIYTGHPLAEIAEKYISEARYLKLHAESIKGKRLVGVAPGSRLHEIHQHIPIIRELVIRLGKRYPDLWFFCPVPSASFEKILRDGFGECARRIEFVPDDCYDLMSASDLLIFKSGTSVQLALLLGVPAVTFYKVGAGWMIKLGRVLFQDMPYYTFPNLLAGREVIPEFIQERFTLPNLYVACTELLDDPAKAGHMRSELIELRKRTIEPDPLGTAAKAICGLIGGDL